jgi:glycosidase
VLRFRIMKKILFTFLFFYFLFSNSFAQVTAEPALPTASGSVVITFDASKGNKGLMGYTGDVYVHIGVITNLSTSSSDWKYVKTNWGVNSAATKLTRIATDLYQLSISPSIREYYGVPQNETIQKMAFVFRSSDATKTGKTETGADIFYDVYTEGLNVKISSPTSASPFQALNANVSVSVTSSGANSIELYHDGVLVNTVQTSTLNTTINAAAHGKHWLKAVASNGTNKVADSVYYFVRKEVITEALPANLVPGINYVDNSKVTLVLYDPAALKQFAFVVGDFTNWQIDEKGSMKRSPDGKYYWITLENLDANTEYLYQYLVDGTLFLADPYCQKVSDPWNDKYISATSYPGLIKYPEGKANGIVSCFKISETPYTWTSTNYVAPAKDKLVVYELLIRDFVSSRDIKSVMDTLNYLQKLGVNAIELMPINEFEGNDSWGYNPSFFFAPDKAYGTKNDFKKFIDECHKRGMAVILDMVLNHSFGSSPMVQMYFDATAGKPSATNPWFNVDATHPYNVGYDFNHESSYTREFSKRVMKFWVDEYKIDGYRFDLSKGFTQKNNPNDVGAWGAYDATRIAIWKEYFDYMKAQKSDIYVILEHFADNSEEKELSAYGMMLWGNSNYNYSQAVQGWTSGSLSDFSWISYKNRSWTNPYVVGYMESHDEERLTYNALTGGNTLNSAHNPRNLDIAMKRMEMAGALFLTIPGPKMIWQFGELGYDYSINSSGGRTAAKPVKWDYLSVPSRRNVYDVWSALLKLRNSHNVFSTTDFALSVSSDMKQIVLNDNSASNPMNVYIVANTGVLANSLTAQFRHTGKWYNYFKGTSLDVTETNMSINLYPGEYIVYTDIQLTKPVLTDIPKTLKNQVNSALVYPVPASNAVNFDLNEQPGQYTLVKIYNTTGQLVSKLPVTESKNIRWDLRSASGKRVSQGLYLYKIEGQGQPIEGKFIVQP